MSGPFMIMLVLDKPSRLDAADIEATIVQQRQGRAIKLLSHGRAHDPIILSFDGVLLTILPIDEPLPPGTLTFALSSNPWREAAQTTSKSRAHIVISSMSGGADIAARVAVANAVTAVAATVSSLSKAVAVYVPSAEALHEPSVFVTPNEASLDLPYIHLWTRLRFGKKCRSVRSRLFYAWLAILRGARSNI